MNKIFFTIVAALMMALVVILLWEFLVPHTPPGSEKTLDPRAPPKGVQAGDYKHHTQHIETWSSHPVDAGGTDAARFEQRQLSGSRGMDASALFPKAPESWEPEPVRTTPPAPCIIGERAPFWYEREGRYNEPDDPEPEPERTGLFSRLRARRNER